jgi:stage II sporulation protein D
MNPAHSPTLNIRARIGGMKKSLALILIVSLSILMLGADSQSAKKKMNPVLRILVIDNKESVLMAIKGSYRVYSTSSDKLLFGGYILHTIVSASDKGIMFGQRDLKFSKISVVVPEGAYIYIEGRAFRGSVDILRKDNMKVMVINKVPLEEYLYGVLYNEISHRWPIEAIKAQAIAARTFALYQARQNKLQDYDLTNDIYSQVYSGAASERWTTTRAVTLTAGKALTYKGDIFPAYYHATCGGHTEDASNLWNVDLGCLKGVECNYCKESPHYRWTKTIELNDLEKKLNDNGYKLGQIKKIEAVSKNNSGRIDKIEIKDDADVSCIVTAKDFRQMLGPNDVRSTNFEPSINGDKLVLKGIGWGHGVGMCQWGAYGMARKGKKADEILKYYYPGTEISTVDKIKL